MDAQGRLQDLTQDSTTDGPISGQTAQPPEPQSCEESCYWLVQPLDKRKTLAPQFKHIVIFTGLQRHQLKPISTVQSDRCDDDGVSNSLCKLIKFSMSREWLICLHAEPRGVDVTQKLTAEAVTCPWCHRGGRRSSYNSRSSSGSRPRPPLCHSRRSRGCSASLAVFRQRENSQD